MSERQRLLAQQNDRFRHTLGMGPIPGSMTMTAGIAALEPVQRIALVRAVITFDAFTAGNDPYGEHDFGSIDHPEVGQVFWKIEYHDLSLQYGSEDPSNLSQTHRVLTIMLASEY